jgi:hypothetical protein
MIILAYFFDYALIGSFYQIVCLAYYKPTLLSHKLVYILNIVVHQFI